MSSGANKNQETRLNSEESSATCEDVERFRFLFENSLDMVVEVSLDGQFLYVSPNVKTVLGYESEELVGSSIFEHVYPEDMPHVQERFALPEASATCRYHHKDGSWRWLETTGRDFLAPTGQTRGVLIIRDITERKHAEVERQQLEIHLRQIQKLEALGTLAGGIAHDFNNLLAVIIGYTELAVMDVNFPLKNLRHLLQVKAASERARQLVQQILTFSRKQKPERKPMRLHSVIEESLELMRHTLPSTVEIYTQIDSEASIVLADATQIHQVVMNLCTNAAHAMQQRPGRLAIALKNCVVQSELIKTIPDLRPGLFVQLTVTDTGHGMNAETLKHIFEPFFTTKGSGEGTGLGLPVVHGIVREHGGAITVQSQPGTGTTFEIYFPALECLLPGSEESLKPLLRGDGQRILLVDDEPGVCASLHILLTRLGYRVTAETNPVNALKIFQESPGKFDLLISDLTMPRMTGIDLASQVLAINPQLPVLLASGSPGGLSSTQMQQLGIRDILPKPASLFMLAEIVHKALLRK